MEAGRRRVRKAGGESMKELEFRSRFAFRTIRGLDPIEVAVQIAREAGLVFEPEVPILPERLEISRDFAMGDGWAILKTVETGNSGLDHSAILAEAVRRYNAWPALRQ